jgi:hypothetical protein
MLINNFMKNIKKMLMKRSVNMLNLTFSLEKC